MRRSGRRTRKWLAQIETQFIDFTSNNLQSNEQEHVSTWRQGLSRVPQDPAARGRLVESGRFDEANALRSGDFTAQLGKAQTIALALGEIQVTDGQRMFQEQTAAAQRSTLLTVGAVLLALALASAWRAATTSSARWRATSMRWSMRSSPLAPIWRDEHEAA